MECLPPRGEARYYLVPPLYAISKESFLSVPTSSSDLSILQNCASPSSSDNISLLDRVPRNRMSGRLRASWMEPLNS